MPDQYQGAAHRTNRAREQARAFKTPPPAGGFLAPGVPVVAAPPPPVVPPPVVPVIGGGAAASAATIGLPLVALATAVVGSISIKRDIDRFKKTAKLPFYDNALFDANRDWSQAKPMYDLEADVAYQQHIQEVLQNYARNLGGDTPYWVYRRGTRWRISKVLQGPPPQKKFGPHNNGKFKTFYGYDLRPGFLATDSWNHVGWQAEQNFTTTAEIQFQPFLTSAGDPHCATSGTGICFLPDPNTAGLNDRYVERYADPEVHHQSGGFDYHEVTSGQVWRRVNNVVDIVELADTEWRLGHGRSAQPWRDAVAPPGSQPSLAQQQASQRLPHGKVGQGYYVLPPLNYPFTSIDVAPGSPQVTVPGVQIEPGVGVTLIPPGGVDVANPGEARERKPRHRFSMAMFINIATEAQDFLEAMHKGLPKKLRRKGRKGIIPDGDIILRDIWDHWDQWNAEKALEAFINNQIEDELLGKYYFGTASKFTRKAAAKHGLPSHAFGGARGIGRGAAVIPMPQIHFADGQYGISMGEMHIEYERSGYGISSED